MKIELAGLYWHFVDLVWVAPVHHRLPDVSPTGTSQARTDLSAHGEGLGYSIKKIFIALFMLTAHRGVVGHPRRGFARTPGCCGAVCSSAPSWKALFIFMYFMHMKFENLAVCGR